jgi:predicted DNA-binding transcriptional regulator AlpA
MATPPGINPPVSGYWSTKTLCERYQCSDRTLNRWMKHKSNPFPKPRLYGAGTTNKWAIEDVLAWEAEKQTSAAA